MIDEMTEKEKAELRQTHSMAKKCRFYEIRGEIKHALVIIDDILPIINKWVKKEKWAKKEKNKNFCSWIYAHKGALENQQMVKVVDMAAEIYYNGHRGHENPAEKVISTEIKNFEKDIVSWFEKALENKEKYNWAYNHLGEAYRQKAISYDYLRLFQSKPENGQDGGIDGKNPEYCTEQKKALEKAKNNFEKARENYESNKPRDRYWNLAHLGATNYYLAIFHEFSIHSLWKDFDKKSLEKLVDMKSLNEAEKHLQEAIEVAKEEYLLYPWARVYLAAIYGIKAKICEDDLLEAKKHWKEAFDMLLMALEEDSNIVASFKDTILLYERRMSIHQTEIEQLLGLEIQNEGNAEKTQAEVKLLGELVQTAQKSAQGALLKNYGDPELIHYILAADRHNRNTCNKLKKHDDSLLQEYLIISGQGEGINYLQSFKSNLDVLGDLIDANNTQDDPDSCIKSNTNETGVRLHELNEDYLRASYYLNQAFYEKETDDSQYKSNLGKNLDEAEKFLTKAFSRSPKLLLKSYLDSTRSLYKDLQKEYNDLQKESEANPQIN